MKLFGERIRSEREEKQLPLRKVAAYLDIDTSILSKIERGERKPTVDLIYKIADFFNLNGDNLLEEFLSENIAFTLYQEKNSEKILKVAEEKVAYLKTINQKQGKINFK